MVSLSSTVAPKAGEKQENVHKTSQGSQTRSLGWSDGCINTYSKMCNWMDGEGNRSTVVGGVCGPRCTLALPKSSHF